jgi:hypothetical protein
VRPGANTSVLGMVIMIVLLATVIGFRLNRWAGTFFRGGRKPRPKARPDSDRRDKYTE